MPLVIGLLIVVATIYQLFFRYESWESDEKPGLIYEHDNLTGETHMMKEGSRVSVFARILGKGERRESDGETKYVEPFKPERERREAPQQATAPSLDSPTSLNSPPVPIASNEPEINPSTINLKDTTQVEKVARPVPVPREVVVASSAPPVPGGYNLLSEHHENGKAELTPFAVKQVDLNQDGSIEEIIQNAVQADGLLDISIVKNGKEIFFGRGQQISLLPSRNQGWADIALKMGAKTLQVFRYNARDAVYRALEDKSIESKSTDKS